MTTITQAAAALHGIQNAHQVCAMRAMHARAAGDKPVATSAAAFWGGHAAGAAQLLGQARQEFAAVATRTAPANDPTFFCPQR